MTLKLRTSWWMGSTMLRFAWRCLHASFYFSFTYVFGCICRSVFLELVNESSYWSIWTSRWSTLEVFVGIWALVVKCWAPYLSECYQCQYLVSLLVSSRYSFQKVSCFFHKFERLTTTLLFPFKQYKSILILLNYGLTCHHLYGFEKYNNYSLFRLWEVCKPLY